MSTYHPNRTGNIVGLNKLLIIATMTLLGVSGLAVASDNGVVIDANVPAVEAVSLDDQATNACFDAFIAKILPGSAVRVRNAIQPGGRPVLSARNNSMLLLVVMEARSAQDNSLLASARCAANNSAKVRSLTTTVADPAKLVGLTPKGITLAAVKR